MSFATQQGTFDGLPVRPARATPFSGIGACALVAYILYLGPWGETFILTVMGDSLRFVNAPYRTAIEVVELCTLALIALVGLSFSFGLSTPITLPPWAVNLSTLGGALPPTRAVRLPVVHFPAGRFAFALAWIILLAIPTVLPLPHKMRLLAPEALKPGEKHVS